MHCVYNNNVNNSNQNYILFGIYLFCPLAYFVECVWKMEAEEGILQRNMIYCWLLLKVMWLLHTLINWTSLPHHTTYILMVYNLWVLVKMRAKEEDKEFYRRLICVHCNYNTNMTEKEETI